ncbi:hypothetical protein NQ318_011128 [Aromia moschata]|uniref:Uncharacterized protein n=1 Tax=Aromia moschata TaxID=1265417 RepID=A0AAV8YSH8_9CUCU|nr:hypothetical protein NQ318_011128 [Aromia moschata]
MILFTDEACFTRRGITNFHNEHVYADENPHAIKQKTISEVELWRLVAAKRSNMVYREDFLCSITALEIAYADDNLEISEIYTEPPDVSCLTDEDSGDEEGEGDLDRLSGRLLHGPVEIRLRNNERKSSETSNFQPNTILRWVE